MSLSMTGYGRGSSMLILALFYGMYLLAWRIYDDKEQVIKITSLIAILGVVNVPIVKFPPTDAGKDTVSVVAVVFIGNIAAFT